MRTYARRLNEADPNSFVETWEQMIKRVVLASNTQLNVGFKHEELKELFELLFNLKCSVAGRFMWQLGTRTVDNAGLSSLMNCCATVVDEPIAPFTWTMNMLMMGCTPPTTNILTGSGIKMIKDVKKGDQVWSFNETTKKNELRNVVMVHDVIVKKEENIQIVGKFGNFVVSKKHPVLVLRNNEWTFVEAGLLTLGDTIQKFVVQNTQTVEFNEKYGKSNVGIPEEIKRCYDRKIFMNFLSGLIDSDGCVVGSEIMYSTCS